MAGVGRAILTRGSRRNWRPTLRHTGRPLGRRPGSGGFWPLLTGEGSWRYSAAPLLTGLTCGPRRREDGRLQRPHLPAEPSPPRGTGLLCVTGGRQAPQQRWGPGHPRKPGYTCRSPSGMWLGGPAATETEALLSSAQDWRQPCAEAWHRDPPPRGICSDDNKGDQLNCLGNTLTVRWGCPWPRVGPVGSTVSP